MRIIHYTISEQDSGKKIQDFLRLEHGYSSRAIVKLKQYADGILLNGSHARAIDLLKAGDDLAVCFRERPERSGVGHILRSNLSVPLCYQDDDLLIYNKPPFMPVHPSCGHVHDTLCNVFASYCDKLGCDLSFRPVNRLDRDTSGAVVVAKNRYAAAKLAQSCEKQYFGIVCGVPDSLSGTVALPIKREQEEEMRRIVHPDGQPSITHYQVLSYNDTHSFVRFWLETGRTHQIRVHMSSIGHPLLGDTMYGSPSPILNRQALHCGGISFSHPVTGIFSQVICPLPQDMLSAASALELPLPTLDTYLAPH